MVKHEVQNLLSDRLGDASASCARVAVHKRVAGATERYEILKHIVSRPPSVFDVVDVEASVGGPAPSASVRVPFEYLRPECIRQTGVARHGTPS